MSQGVDRSRLSSSQHTPIPAYFFMASTVEDFTDLHCHSVYSDGTCTPQELITIAKQKHLVGIALTDHDTVEGLEELIQASKTAGVKIITGVELSANHGDIPVHILGYGFDHKHPSLHNNLKKIQKTRKTRNNKIFENINGMGIDISWPEIHAIAGTGQIGRPHFATFLINKGLVQNNAEAFNLYLRKDKPAYAKREILTIEDAIDYIHKAHGLAVIAHPGMLPCNQDKTMQLIETFIKMGLDGVEAYYPTHSNTLRNRLLGLCRTENLAVTGGSDYHGEIRSNTSLGGHQRKHYIPATVFTELYERTQALSY